MLPDVPAYAEAVPPPFVFAHTHTRQTGSGGTLLRGSRLLQTARQRDRARDGKRADTIGLGKIEAPTPKNAAAGSSLPLAANQEQDSDRQAQGRVRELCGSCFVRVSVSCPDPGPGMEFGPGSIPVCFNPPVRRRFRLKGRTSRCQSLLARRGAPIPRLRRFPLPQRSDRSLPRRCSCR